MDIRVLQYFLAVAREESISRAADFLHITQPPLSRQLKELEEELGASLFIRGSRKITLTEEGLILRKRAEELVYLMEKTKADIRSSQETITGTVSIGCAETDAMRLIARTIRHVQDVYPEVQFSLSSGNAEDVEDRLDKGLLDFGIFIEPMNLTKYDFLRLPAKNIWGLLMRKDDPLASKASLTAEDLLPLPLFFSSQEMARNELAGWSGDLYEKFHIRAYYNLVYNASLLVEEGAGCALCLDRIIQTAEGCPLCFRPLEPRLEAGVLLGWKKYQLPSKAARLFLRHLRETLQTLS